MPNWSRVDCEFFAFSKEVAPTTGTPHLQGFLLFKKERLLSAVIKDFSRSESWKNSHLEVMHGTLQQNQQYCSKQSKLIVLCGDVLPPEPKDVSDHSNDFADALRLVQSGDIDNVRSKYPEIYLRYYSALHREADRCAPPPPKPKPRERLLNFWIYGKTGTGKTSGVIDRFGEDNVAKCPVGQADRELVYENQEVYLIDDFDYASARSLPVQLLKQLADHYPFSANYRYAKKARSIRPPIVVITSQHQLKHVYGHVPEEDLKALERRFTVFEKTTDNEIPWDLWLNGNAPSVAECEPTVYSLEL